MLPGNGDSSLNRTVRVLRATGLAGLAAAVLDQGGPLAFFGAQALYFAAPVLDGLGPARLASDLAEVLEDPEQSRALAGKLRERGSARSAGGQPSPGGSGGINPPATGVMQVGESRASETRATGVES
jgi:hypothetical protein